MANVVLIIDKAKAIEVEQALLAIPNGFNRAAASAINKTVKTGITRISHEIREKMNVKHRAVLDVITPIKANQSTLAGGIRINQKGIPLAEFIRNLGRQSKSHRGIDVTVFADEGTKNYPRMFVTRSTRGGQYGVYSRQKSAGGLVGRFPIHLKQGPSVLTAFEKTPGIPERVMATLTDTLNKNLDSQIDRLLDRKQPETE